MALEGSKGMLAEMVSRGASPSDPRATPTEMITRGLGGLLGVDARTPDERLNNALRDIDPNDPQAMQAGIAALVQSNATNPGQKLQGIQAAQKIQEAQAVAQQEQRRRQALGNVAKVLKDRGFEGLAGAVATGVMKPKDAFREARMKEKTGDRGDVSPTLMTTLVNRAEQGDKQALVFIEQLSASPTDTNHRAAMKYAFDTEEDPNSWLSQFSAEDLNNPEGVERAEVRALQEGDARLADSLADRKRRLVMRETGVDATDAVDAATAVNPDYQKQAQLYSYASQLKELTEMEGAGVAALQERLTTAFHPNDLRAQQELARFRNSKSLPRRVEDTLDMWAQGRLSDATKEDYKAVADSMQEYYRNQAKSTAEALRSLGGNQNKSYAEAIMNITDVLKRDEFDGFIELPPEEGE